MWAEGRLLVKRKETSEYGERDKVKAHTDVCMYPNEALIVDNEHTVTTL